MKDSHAAQCGTTGGGRAGAGGTGFQPALHRAATRSNRREGAGRGEGRTGVDTEGFQRVH